MVGRAVRGVWETSALVILTLDVWGVLLGVLAGRELASEADGVRLDRASGFFTGDLVGVEAMFALLDDWPARIGGEFAMPPLLGGGASAASTCAGRGRAARIGANRFSSALNACSSSSSASSAFSGILRVRAAFALAGVDAEGVGAELDDALLEASSIVTSSSKIRSSWALLISLSS